MAWDDTKVANDNILSADYNSMVTDQKTRIRMSSENKRGSNCSGSDGAVGRVLTLANTSLTVSTGFKVFRSGVLIDPDSITIVHNTSGSTITFTTLNVFNTDYIYVEYTY